LSPTSNRHAQSGSPRDRAPPQYALVRSQTAPATTPRRKHLRDLRARCLRRRLPRREGR
jgi:hypothetical protein